MSITPKQAAEGINRKVIYRPPGQSLGPGEEGVITSVSPRGAFVRYGRDVSSKLTNFDDLQFAGPSGRAVVDNPTSVTHFICPVAEHEAGPKRSSDDNLTHRIVGGRCTHCKLTASSIRAQEGLD